MKLMILSLLTFVLVPMTTLAQTSPASGTTGDNGATLKQDQGAAVVQDGFYCESCHKWIKNECKPGNCRDEAAILPAGVKAGDTKKSGTAQ